MVLALNGSAASGGGSNWFDAKNYGAAGDGSTDDTDALLAAWDALKANVNAGNGSWGAQTYYLPPGHYKTTASLDFSGCPQVRFVGGSGRGGYPGNNVGTPADTLVSQCAIIPSAASAFGVNLQDCSGIVWDGIDIVSGPAFGGRLMNFDTDYATPAFGNRVQNCRLSAPGTTGVRLLTMNYCIEHSIDNVVFGYAPGGQQVRMVDESAGSGAFSNANSFRSCSFIGDRTTSVLDPGTQTSFLDCTFEGTDANTVAPIVVDYASSFAPDAISFTGCGFWDIRSGSGAWIKASVATRAWALTGLYFETSTGYVIDLASHTGLALSGCMFRATAGGSPTVFKPAQNITNGSMLGCAVSGVTDNHASVFV